MTEEQAAQYKMQEGVDPNQQLTIQTEDSQDGQITAEVVQADQPSPGKFNILEGILILAETRNLMGAHLKKKILVADRCWTIHSVSSFHAFFLHGA